MDKVLAFSILSASPADIAAAATSGSRWTKLSWRQGSAGDHDPANKASVEEQQGRSSRSRDDEAGRRCAAREQSSVPRFAPEFDGIDCFETIVSH